MSSHAFLNLPGAWSRSGFALATGLSALVALTIALGPPVWRERPVQSVSPFKAALSRGLVRMGVERPPHEIGPADYQIRRAEGFVPEIGQTIAAALSTRVQFVRIDTGSEADALANGSIDLALVSKPRDSVWTNDTEIPVGHVTRLAPVMREDTSIRSWEDLAGRTICFSDDDAAANRLIDRLGGVPVAASAPAKALAAMRSGECDASLHDADLVNGLAQLPNARWAKYSATLPPRQASQLMFVFGENDDFARRKLRDATARWGRRFWNPLVAQWIADVDFEVYLEQDAPDCH